MVGKEIRIERIMDRNSCRTVIVPLDHGVSIGPVEGIKNMKKTVDEIAKGGANAIILHKGLVEAGHRRSGKDLGLIVHLSASTVLAPDPNAKVLVATVEEAIKLGADGISIHVNIGAENESAMLRDFGYIAGKAQEWGMPLLAMVYTRGPKIKNEYDVQVVKHAARVGCELGADIIKVPYTGTPESFREVVEGCPKPIVIAGGPKMTNDREVFEMVEGAIAAGAAGVSIGRNAFQHPEPSRMLAALCRIVHEGSDIEKALKVVNGY